jgi:hypothetical protein
MLLISCYHVSIFYFLFLFLFHNNLCCVYGDYHTLKKRHFFVLSPFRNSLLFFNGFIFTFLLLLLLLLLLFDFLMLVLGVQKIPLSLVCNSDIDRPLRFEILDWDNGGHHTFMGQVDTSVRALMDSAGHAINVIDPAKAAKHAKKGTKYINSGTFHSTYTYIEENPTFSDVSVSRVYV